MVYVFGLILYSGKSDTFPLFAGTPPTIYDYIMAMGSAGKT
jgi:hypothetical protein